MLQHVSILYPFLWLNNTPFSGEPTFHLSMQSIDGHLVCFHFGYYEQCFYETDLGLVH